MESVKSRDDNSPRHGPRRRDILAGAAALTAAPVVAAAEPGIDVLARVGPWPVASRLIGYRGRLWLANSVKGRNHNSADIWSLDPASGAPRYERHLYSQDAGYPLVHDGLLYWPFEDSRFSFGWGMAEVTNGATWRPLVIPTAQIFHTHSILSWGGSLVAVTSAWRTGLQISDDGGRRWRRLHVHLTAKRHLARFHEPTLLRGQLYGYLKDVEGIRLTRFTGKSFQAVPDWPRDLYFFSPTRHRGFLYAVVRAGDGHREIWRTDGTTSALVGRGLGRRQVMDLKSDGQRLWAISLAKGGGRLWSSADGAEWRGEGVLSGGEPRSLAIVAGTVYAAGAGDDGRGIVWGPRRRILPEGAPPPAPPIQFAGLRRDVDWAERAAALDDLLARPESYENHARGALRGAIFAAVRDGAPAGFFSGRLRAPRPAGTVPAFGGQMDMAAADIGASMLLWAMGLAQRGEVPPALLTRAWDRPANSFQKYFSPQPAAIWAVVAAGQKERAVIEALVARLGAEGDPAWIRAQVVGALTALTGERFAHDAGAWHGWWSSARTNAAWD